MQGPLTDRETIKKIREHINNRRPFYQEILNYNRMGEEYWISLAINPVFDEEGNLERFISIQANITDTKIAALEYNYRLEAIDRVSAILELDLNAVITHANDNFNAIFNRNKKILGEHLASILHSNPDDNMSFEDIWRNPAYQDFRASLLHSRKEIDICRNCSEGTQVWG